MNKILTLVFVLLVSLVAVQAADYAVNNVEVDDINAASAQAVYVQRGSTVDVEVFLTGNSNITNDKVDDVRVKVWIGGYEYGDVEYTSDIFEVEENVSYKKTLKLDVPEDIDASKDYTLHVEVYDDINVIDNVYTLRVQEARHQLRIRDVMFNPSSTVEAGQPLFATVRVENMGDKKEENVKVILSIPALGLTTRGYIDELAAHEDTDTSEDNEDEEDSGSVSDLYLVLPKDAKTGIYDVVVDVEYSRGHETESETFPIAVKAKEVEQVTSVTPSLKETVVITVDSQTKDVSKGKGAVYKVLFANLGQTAKTYTLNVESISFGATRVDPGVVSVAKDGTAEAYVYVSSNENTNPGIYSFKLRVNEGAELVKEVSISSNVVEEEKKTGVDAKTVLEGLFILLLVILIVLGVIVAVKRSKGAKQTGKPEEPHLEQSYY